MGIPDVTQFRVLGNTLRTRVALKEAWCNGGEAVELARHMARQDLAVVLPECGVGDARLLLDPGPPRQSGRSPHGSASSPPRAIDRARGNRPALLEMGASWEGLAV